VDEAGDMRLAEKYDLNGYEGKRDEVIRLVESLRLEPRHVFRLRLGDSVPPSTSRGTSQRTPTVERSAPYPSRIWTVIASLVESGRKLALSKAHSG
jgi:hypothetical protein